MSYPRWSPALLALGLCAADCPAQGSGFLNPYLSSGGYSHRHKGSIQITVGTYSSRAYLLTPYAYPSSQVTVVYYTPPTVVVVAPPRPPDEFGLQAPTRIQPREPMPPADAGDAGRPPERERVPRPPTPEPPAPLPAPKPEPRPPQPPPMPPPEERETETARLMRLGREAMAGGEYGRAAERFRRAADLGPREALPRFLLGQALLALAKYAEAADALYAGLALEPDWPASTFRPLELYGAKAADYREHLRRLEETLARYPDDPVLLFLSGYALWFDGRKDEARLLFRRALPGSAQPAAIQRFLAALPGAPI
jgi:hypothetical protein